MANPIAILAKPDKSPPSAPFAFPKITEKRETSLPLVLVHVMNSSYEARAEPTCFRYSFKFSLDVVLEKFRR